jgi:hypothetical protein
MPTYRGRAGQDEKLWPRFPAMRVVLPSRAWDRHLFRLISLAGKRSPARRASVARRVSMNSRGWLTMRSRAAREACFGSSQAERLVRDHAQDGAALRGGSADREVPWGRTGNRRQNERARHLHRNGSPPADPRVPG